MLYRYIKILRFLFYPLYLISFFIPRTKKIWLFGAHQNRYAENSKALFIYSSNHQGDIKCIWVTGSKKLYKQLRKDDYNACLRWSLKGLYYSLRAKYYFYNLYSDDINYYTSGNAIMVNLWHGIPLKKIEFDIKKGAQYKMFNSIYSPIYRFFKPYIFRDPDYILSTSQTISKLFSSAFRVSTSQCLEFGYPRCDLFYDKALCGIDSTVNVDASQRNIIYMPTWRNTNTDFIHDAFSDLSKLNTVLKTDQSTLYIKLHPNTKTVQEQFSNIVFLDSSIDIYDFLPQTDMLITDYSSIYFDYLLLDKEILFYPFDYDDYALNDREFYFDYDTYTPGKKVYSFESLLKALSALDTFDYSEEREVVKNRLWKYQDANASQRVYNYVRSL